MMKLFAIFTVLASIPTSALAGEVPTSSNSAIHCDVMKAPSVFAKSSVESAQVEAGNAAKAQ